ncbi:MAG TPA: DUF86 domain-containing protein [Thermoanaerobaculia bacterium]|nr:DUF86 domain-containing protein [Thermoanaerobaculia bacterium]
MTIDRELVTRKMLLITRDLEQLRAMFPADLNEYLDSLKDQAMLERYLERMIGRAIDINFHLITESGGAPPPDYHSSFMRLAEMKVLDREFASRIARAAGLRNRLVHEYETIDQRKLYAAGQSALRDIPAYLQQIENFLSRES